MSLLRLYENLSTPVAPSSGQWNLYSKPTGVYVQSISGEIGPLGAALTTAGGDLYGTYPNPTVVGINGAPIGPTAQTVGDALVWNGSQWDASAVLNASTAAGGDLSGTYPNPTVAALQGSPVSTAAPNVGDVLTWDGFQWVPTAMPSTSLTPANFDAFGRLRISAPQTIFDSKLVYDQQSLYWTEKMTGAGTSSNWSNFDACQNLVIQDPGAYIIRQTKRYFNYQPGKSHLIFQTFNLYGFTPDVTKRVGYFDDDNGIFLQLDPTTASICRRSQSTTGSLTVPQSAWNVDRLDGTGASGLTLQWGTTQILVIDFEWLGVGSVRVGFVINGEIVYAHQFNNANVNGYVYMSTPNLPVRYELEATGPAPFYATMACICSSVSSEGGIQGTGTKYSFSTPAAVGPVSNGGSATLFNVQHDPLKPRVTIIPQTINALAKSNGMSRWELVLNATIGGTPSWSTVGYTQVDTAGVATVAPTSVVIASGVFSNNAPATNLDLANTTLTLGTNVDGTVSDTLSLIVYNLSGGNETYLGSIDWLALT